jgi:hypothetical protein
MIGKAGDYPFTHSRSPKLFWELRGIPKIIGTNPLKGNLLPSLNYQGIIYYLLSVFCILFLLASCGRKGEPTLKSYEKPDPPSELRAIHRDSEIILLWKFPKDKESSIKGFYLMKIIPPTPPLEKGGRADFEKIAFLENNKRSYIDTNFNVGSLYKYKIVSQNLRDVTSNDSNIIEVEPKNPPPPPAKLSFKIVHDSLTLTWKSVGEGILYNIYKTDKKGLFPLMPVNEKPIKETFFKDSLNITKPFYYTIRSLMGGDIWDEGPASQEIEVNTPGSFPSHH